MKRSPHQIDLAAIRTVLPVRRPGPGGPCTGEVDAAMLE